MTSLESATDHGRDHNVWRCTRALRSGPVPTPLEGPIAIALDGNPVWVGVSDQAQTGIRRNLK